MLPRVGGNTYGKTKLPEHAKRTKIEGIVDCGHQQATLSSCDNRDSTVMEDSNAFGGYVQTTVDPGSSLVVATVIFGVLLFSFLPCMISLGNRYEKRQEEESSEKKDAEEISELHDRENRNENHKRLSRMSLAVHAPVESFLNEDEERSISSHNSSVSLASTVMNKVLGSASRAGSATRHRGGRRRKRVSIYHNGLVLEDLSAPVLPLDFDLGSSIHSALPRMDHDEVSFHDAVDAHDPAYKNQNKSEEGMADDRLCCGSDACWKPSSIARAYDKLLVVAEWNYETTRVCRLAFPFVCQALLTSSCEVTRVAMIGLFLGTRELSAYLIVGILLGLTASLIGGLQDSMTTLCTAAIEAGNKKLAGQYVQLSIVCSILFSGANIALWMIFIVDVLEWFGFDQETRSIGQDFATLLLLRDLIRGVSLNIHGLLYVIGLDVYSTVLTTVEEVLTTVAVVVAVLCWESTLETIGIIYIISTYSILILNLVIIKLRGWFYEFREGLVGPSAFLNFGAIWTLVTTASSLSFVSFLAYKEWEILTFFVSFLGPAEVVAWGILGTVWNALGEVIGAVADSAEARCTFLLGIGEPLRAKLSSYKSIFIGFVFSTVVTSCILIAGEDFPTWVTRDPVLQNIVADLIPLLAIGNIALGMNTMSSTLVGSQGRNRLATTVGVAAIWLVSIPLTALFSIVLNIDLQGQTAAVAIGSMVSSTLNTYILLQSDWDGFSRQAMANIANDQADPNDVTDDADASVSSSSSSSSSSSAPSPSVARSTSSSVSCSPSTSSVPASVHTEVLQSRAYGSYCADTCLPDSFFENSAELP